MKPSIQNDLSHFHYHSNYSTLEGLSDIKKIVKKAKNSGIKHMAFTETGTMLYALHFYKKCKANDINPIIGCEFYIEPEKKTRIQITLLVKNHTGYKNLMMLSSIVSTQDFHNKTIIDENILIQYSSDLICILSFPDKNKSDEPDVTQFKESQKIEAHYRKIFGEENFYQGELGHGNPKQETNNPDAIKSSDTVKIAESCNLQIDFPGPLLPDYPTPENFNNPDEYLRFLTHKGLSERYSVIAYEIENRNNYELDIIINMGFTGYFLIVWDYVNYARENDIPIGPGRGSSAGSLVAYALKITDIDPLEHGLMFERFLNPERIGIPDIEVDFCIERKQEVMDYVAKKYGSDKVCRIKDASNYLSAIVIGRSKLTDYVPLYRDPKTGSVLTQYTMNLLEDCGLVKFDFFGLRELTINKRVEKLIKKIEPDFDVTNIPTDDKAALDIFRTGDTKGILQFESEEIQDFLRQLHPESMEELIALNALYRPGSIQFIPRFIECKNNRRAIIYPDPDLEEVLKSTYGVIVYQEQIMEISRIIGGFSLGKADILRRAMGKKKIKIIDKMKTEFISGAVKKGYTLKKATDIFEILVTSSGHAFSKAHAAGYVMIAYRTAYLKAHFPGEFEQVYN